MVQDYYADKSKKLEALDPAEVLREIMRKNLIVDGNFPQGDIDPMFADKAKFVMPKALVEGFLKMQKNCIKFRLSQDKDFQAAMAPNSQQNEGQFENLKKLN